jgi:predicted DNA-binding transcriptional regulator YafY
MPPLSEALLRYEIIDRCLTHVIRRFPSIEDIKKAIEEELNTKVSTETIQKDIAKMKQPINKGGFGAPIRFKKMYNGYYYDFDKYPGYTIKNFGLTDIDFVEINTAFGILKRFKNRPINSLYQRSIKQLNVSLQLENYNRKDKSETIFPEIHSNNKGLEYFEVLTSGIQQQKPVSLIYYSYEKNKFKTDIFHPYLLKESNETWYAIGYSEQNDSIRYYDLNRITDPIMLSHKYFKNEDTHLFDLYENRVGVKELDKKRSRKIETVIFKASNELTRQLEVSPIHQSQRIVGISDTGESTIQLNVVPTYELLSILISLGSEIEIQSPDWFKNELIKYLTMVLGKYKID